MPLTIRLFGSFEVEQGGLPLPRTRTAKEKWLLALLVLRHREMVDRVWLAGTLWPDSSETQGLGNLRRSLNNLRQSLGENAYRLFAPTPRTISFDLSGVNCDMVEFDSARTQGDVAARERAVSLYRGLFLADCPEVWAEMERNRRGQEYLALVEWLAAHFTASGDREKTLHYLRLAVLADPFREATQQALIRTLADSGDITGAMLAYRQFRLKLHEELQTAPTPETTALYQQIRRGSLKGATTQDASAPSSPEPASPALPRPLSRLIGRQDEIIAVLDQLAAARLVTLLGSGGVGKTRLSLAVAERIAGDFPGGIWFVELAAISDPALVEQVVAETLALSVPPDRSVTATLTDFLRQKHALLVLDNCEHLIDACATLVKTLTSACPNLRALTTSRQPLGLRGEIHWRVPSLPLPDNATGASRFSVADALRYDAIRLFLDRAQEASPHFVLTDQNADAAVQVCRQLDGIPLAIELAAARVRTLSVEEIRQRLSHRFRLLTTGDRSALPRHQTLRALIDWSYDLLTEPEKTLLYRLSVFVGGWTLAAAEAVVSDHETLTTFDILDLLTSLVDKSLVTAGESGSEGMRFGMLETVREYAAEKRVESGEDATLRDRHRDWFVSLAEEARPHFGMADQNVWLQRINADNDNIRSALAWCAEQPTGAEAGLRIATNLYRFWWIRANLREGREQMYRAQSHPGAREFPLLRGRALYFIGLWEHQLGDSERAVRCLEESLEVLRPTGDRVEMAQAKGNLGLVLYQLRDFDRAQPLLEEVLAVQREQNNRQQIAICLNNLGVLHAARGDTARTRALYEECLALRRELGNLHGVAMVLSNLGGLAHEQENDPARALSLLQEGLAIWFQLESLDGVSYCLRHIGHLSALQGHPENALRLWGAEEVLREKTGQVLVPEEQEPYAQRIRAARSRVGPDADTLWTEGRTMTLEQAVQLALEKG